MLAVGSCFAEHVGRRLEESKLPVCLNPMGILFNPASIAGCIERLITGEEMKGEDLLHHHGLWLSLHHHGRYSHPDKQACLDAMNRDLRRGADHLGSAALLVLTFGTAFAFEDVESGNVVANCHRLPAERFRRRLLAPGDIVDRLAPLLHRLSGMNSGLRILLTVSPVRHLRDHPTENQVSKSTLILAAHDLVTRFDHVDYFPAYEIMMDDLRDYRFYDRDRAHPSEEAVDYILEKFVSAHLDEEARELMDRMRSLQKALAHRPLYPSSDAFQRFVKIQLETVETLQSRYPELDLVKERDHFRDLLAPPYS